MKPGPDGPWCRYQRGRPQAQLAGRQTQRSHSTIFAALQPLNPNTGRPDFDINVGDLKPNWLVGVAAVALLAVRQPLTGVKTFGDRSFTDPFTAIAKVTSGCCIMIPDNFGGCNHHMWCLERRGRGVRF